VAGTPI